MRESSKPAKMSGFVPKRFLHHTWMTNRILRRSRTSFPPAPGELKILLCSKRYATAAAIQEAVSDAAIASARPAEEVPGPKSLPLIGTLYKYIPVCKYVYQFQYTNR